MTESDERITCQELTELTNDYIEGTLPSHEMALFEQHLNFCDGCVLYVDQVRLTIDAVGNLSAEDVPPETTDKLMAAFRDWKRQ